MVSVVKTDKLLAFYGNKFLSFEWTLGMSDLRSDNTLRSSDFDMGGAKPSLLEIRGRSKGPPSMYFHNPNCVENGLFTIIIYDKTCMSFFTAIKAIDPGITSEYIELLLGIWSEPSPAQYPLQIFGTIRANALFTTTLPKKIITPPSIQRKDIATNTPHESSVKEDVLQENATSCLNLVKVLCTDFQNLLEQEANTDMILRVDEVNIKAHKVVLEARSPVFRKMFANGSSEANQNTVTISDIKLATVKGLLRFLYTAEMEKCTCDELQELYYAADKYEVWSLRDGCKRELLKCIQLENVCALFTLANRHNDEELKKAVVEFVKVNFNSVVSESQFLEMNNEDMALLMRLSVLAMKNNNQNDVNDKILNCEREGHSFAP